MKSISLALLLAVWLGFPASMTAAVSPTTSTAATTATNSPATTTAADPRPTAQKLCETVSLITGVAISPLMGVGLVGAIEYFKSPAEQRARLPWFASPWFWAPALALVLLCFIKDTAGVTLPVVLKKPFDMLEAIEHKLSGLIAAGAFVPIAAAIFSAPPSPTDAALASAGLAALNLHWLYNLLIVPVAIVAFLLVFLASNAINTLILLSPFTTVDAALKGFRVAVLASVAVTAWVNPWMGALWALALILFSWLIAGWSLRLSHFGSVFIWDFFTNRRGRFHPDACGNKMFLGARLQKVPPRTYGRLVLDEKGGLTFIYRPWLVLPPRTIVLPGGSFETGRGLFYSEILRLERDRARTLFLLPPRYRGHEEEITQIYRFAGTRDVGLRTAWAWLKSLFGGKRAVA